MKIVKDDLQSLSSLYEGGCHVGKVDPLEEDGENTSLVGEFREDNNTGDQTRLVNVIGVLNIRLVPSPLRESFIWSREVSMADQGREEPPWELRFEVPHKSKSKDNGRIEVLSRRLEMLEFEGQFKRVDFCCGVLFQH